ncbi:pentapeptide repeat-containing protein [Nocardia sp.]|uniref:pentapeptide repeat-containing protein n=1 Tax=Nocardia sp. TaxID=1821 RepID=UPI0025887611|nr:pentapeptide repeat-containing protein [Nocardia sp.]
MAGKVSAVRARARTKAATLRAWASKDSRAALGRRIGRIRLFTAVALALLTGLSAAFVAYGFLRWTISVDTKKDAAEIDVTRVALTVVAGVGGVVALVIAYRRQRDMEESRFVERFGAAASQLGATDVAVRIAGVYAMAGVADGSDGLHRQQCINVLCGYLRMPYRPEFGANHQSKLILKQHRASSDGTRSDDQECHLEYRHNDREVRATIVRVVADHLRPTAESNWSSCDFDFRTAHLENIDLSNVKFSGAAKFGRVTFSGYAEFGGATFLGPAGFGGATFLGTAGFGGTTFSGTTGFGSTTFSDTARFGGATFLGAAEFGGTTFSGIAEFHNVRFASTAEFGDAKFSGDASFVQVDFGTEAISFVRPKQWGPPAPAFDWDQDLSQKPTNVEPQDWPPIVVPAA